MYTNKLQGELDGQSPYYWERSLPSGGIRLEKGKCLSWFKEPAELHRYKDLLLDTDEPSTTRPAPPWASDLWLAPGRRKRGPRKSSLVHPLDRSLHRAFASLSETDQIIAFACKQGFLGGPVAYVELENQNYRSGESLAEWRWQVFRMNTLTLILDLIKRPDKDSASRLRSFFHFDQELECKFDPLRSITHGFKYPTKKSRPVGAKDAKKPLAGMSDTEIAQDLKTFKLDSVEELEEIAGKSFGPENIVDVAKRMVTYEVNRELERWTHLHIDKKHPERLQVHASSLRGAIYCSLMMEMTGQTSVLKRCQTCGDWFETLDARQKFCCPEHRHTAHRRKLSSDTGEVN